MLIEVLIITITTLASLIYIFLTWNFNYWKRRGIPGPEPKVLFGTVPSIITRTKSMSTDINEIYQKYKNIDRFAGIFLIRKPTLLLLDPILVHEILTTKYKHFSKNDVSFIDPNVDKLFSRNPFLLDNTECKEQRSQVMPSLSQSRIKSLHPVLMTICKRLTKFIENENYCQSKAIFNGRQIAARFTIENIANFVYGFEAGAFSPANERCELLEMSYGFLDSSIMSEFYLFISQAIPSIRYIYSRPAIPKKNQDYLFGLIKHAIKIRKQYPNNRTDFLNYLLQLQEKKDLSLFDLTAHITTFYFGGFETSSVTISNCLYLLAVHQDVQDRLRQEIREIFPVSSENEMNDSNIENEVKMFEKILDLKYFDNVINETLRLIPASWFLSKICTEPCEFKNSNGESIQILKGDVLNIPVSSIHRDERFYKDALEFKPERFDEYEDAAKKFKDMGIFIPFGDGPRICLGQKLAMTQVKAAIFELVRNWKIKLSDKTVKKFEPDPKALFFTLKGGVWLEFERIY